MKMDVSAIKTFAKTAGKYVEKKAPVIAAGVAIATMIGAVVSAVKAVPECQKMLDEAHIKKNEKALDERMKTGDDSTPIVELSTKERLLIYTKAYWPTCLLAVMSATCMVGSVYFGNKQIKALAVLCAAAENSLVEFKSAAQEVIGDKKIKSITDKIVDNKLEQNPPSDEVIIDTGKGKHLCYEPWLGIWFWSDISAVDAAFANFLASYGESISNDGYGGVYFIEFCEELGIMNGRNVSMIPSGASDIFGEFEGAKLAKNLGYFKNIEENISYKPVYSPMSKMATLNGEKVQVYIPMLNEPKSEQRLEMEAHSSRLFFRD